MPNPSVPPAPDGRPESSIAMAMACLPALTTLSRVSTRLSDPAFDGFVAQQVTTILDAGELVKSIATETSALVQTIEELGSKTTLLGKQEGLSILRRELLEIIEQSRGQGRSGYTLDQLSGQTAEWLQSFHRFVSELEIAERHHQAAMEFLETLDRIKLLVLSRGCLAPFRKSWQQCEEAVRRHVGMGDLQSATAALLPFAKRWAAMAEVGPALASHYRVTSPLGLVTEVHGPGELLAQLGATAAWIEDAVLPLLAQISPPELPDIPGAVWTPSYPSAELAMFIELQLAASRALAVTPNQLLQRISDLAMFCSSHPSAWITERESQTLATVLEQALVETNSCSVLAAARALFGDRSDTIIAPVIVRTASNQLWRLPGSSNAPDPCVLDEKPLIHRAVLGAPSEVSLVTRLHVEIYGEPLRPATSAHTELFSQLSELGTFGAWCFAAYLDLTEVPIDEPLLKRHFTNSSTGRLRHELAFPLARIRKPSYEDPGTAILFAALELLFPPTVDLPYAAAWRVSNDRGDDIPHLRSVLENLALHASSDRQVVLASSGAEADLAAAERAALDLIRPFRFRNRRSLAKASTEFQRETAEPLLSQARTAHEVVDCRAVLDRLEQEREALDNNLDNKLRSDVHLDQVGKAKLLDHCQRILVGITEYLRKKQALRTKGSSVVPTRNTLAADLDRVATWGWAGHEASILMRSMLVERTVVLPPNVWPGETTNLPPMAWLLPRCVDLWRSKNFDLIPYGEALEEDLRGPDPAHYAILRAGECQIEWGREVLQHLPEVTPDLLRQFEDEKSVWQGIVENDRVALDKDIQEQGLILSEDERELMEAIEEDMRSEAFSAAEDGISQLRQSLRDPRRTSGQRVAAAQKVREELNVLLDEMTADRFDEKSVWRDSLAQLVEFSTHRVPSDAALGEAMHDQEVRQLQQDWERLRTQLLERTRSLPTLGPERSPAFSPQSEDLPPATLRQHPNQPCFGIVKKLAMDYSRGFITAFDPELLNHPGDLYFEKDWYSGTVANLGIGSLVELASISKAPGREQLQARHIQPVLDSRKGEVRAQLEDLASGYDENIGVVVRYGTERRVLNEIRGCQPQATGSALVEVGDIVRFEMTPSADGSPRPRVLGLADAIRLNGFRKALLDKIARTPGGTKTQLVPLSFQGTKFQPSWLRQLYPNRVNTVVVVRLLRSRITELGCDAELVEAVRRMIAERAPYAIWLQAMFSNSFVRVARQRHQPENAVLEELTNAVPQWWLGNLDVTAYDLFSSLKAIIQPPSLETAPAPGPLTWDELYKFFSVVQTRLGRAPHFRVELILARILRAQLEYSSDSEFLGRALKHVERSLVLNPAQTEAKDLRRTLIEEWEEREAETYKPKSAPTVRNWDELPEGFVEQVEHIRGYYAKPDLALAAAEKQFEEWRPRTGGVALEELMLSHARLLTNWNIAERAHDLLMQHALSGTVSDWSRTLSTLSGVWGRMELPFDRIRQQTLALEQRAPKQEQFRLYLILARSAEDQALLAEARRYAEAAHSARPDAAETQLLLRRLGQDVRQEDDSSRQEDVWNQISAAATEGTARIDQILAPYMDEPDLGPPLLLRAILERDAFDLQLIGRQELCRRLAYERPSAPLFLAAAEVQAEQYSGCTTAVITSVSQRVEHAFSADEIQTVLMRPLTAPQLAEFAGRFKPNEEWHALAFFQTLARFRAGLPLPIYFQGLAARRAAVTDNSTVRGRRAAHQIYFESSLRCLDQLPEVTYSSLARDFAAVSWHGLALALASLAPEQFAGQIPKLIENARPKPASWPALRCEANLQQRDDWVNAANAAVCALLAAPDYWACCCTFFDVFRNSNEPVKSLEIALSFVDDQLSRMPKPELRVLKAQLLEQSVGLDTRRTWEEVRSEMYELCKAAHIDAGGAFEPASRIQDRLDEEEQKEPEFRVGMRILGRYDIIRPIARGSFGQLYKAKLTDDGRMVALKQLYKSTMPDEMEQRRRMLREEAEFLRQLTDPHVPQFIGYSEDPPALAMEWIDGDTVFKLRNSRITFPDWRKVAALARQLAGAMRSAYDLAERLNPGYEFAHRDVHSANVMIILPKDEGGRPMAKLLDFGLARLPKSLLSSEAKKVASSDLPYRDPDWPKGGLLGDMFSLGVVLYDLLVGWHPYGEGAYRDYRSIGASERSPQGLLASLRPLPDDYATLAPVLERMVRPRAKERFDDWDDLLRALNQLDGAL